MTSAILLSGGQDSTAIAHWLRPQYAITINYGQLAAEAELRSAKEICRLLGIEQLTVSVDCSSLGSGDLNNKPAVNLAPSSEWWPYRNQLILTLASTIAISHGIKELMIGTVLSDSGHADGRKEFIKAINHLISIQEGGLIVSAPAINMTTVELIKESRISMDILCWAHSCHRSNFACGRCRGCIKHKNVLYELGEEPY